MYGALTTTFRDRVRFAFASEQSQAEATALIKQEFNVKSIPALVIQLKDGSRSIYGGKMKLPEIVTWIMPHALSEKVEP